jgi:hypothetical protein
MKITRLLAATAIAVAVAAPALAADMPVKAHRYGAAAPNEYPTTSCGAYYGITASGSSAVVNGAPAGTVQIGGNVGGLVGYACPTASIPWFAQVEATFQNLNAGNAGFSLNGPAEIKLVAGVYTPLMSWVSQWLNLGTIPPITPLLPPGVSTIGIPQNYLAAVTTFDDVSAASGAADFHDWLWTPIGIRTGLLYNLNGPNGVKAVGDVFAELDLQSDAMTFGAGAIPGATSAKMGERAVIGVQFKM